MKRIMYLALLLCGCLLLGATAGAATYEGYTQAEFDALEATTVVASADSPTGYYVTFRYKDPDADRVRIYGEWKFSDLAHASVSTSLNAMPEDWQDGYTIWKTDGWPTSDLVKNEATGVWSYTIPLPTGTWGYRFYVGGTEGAELVDYTDAVITWDPNNLSLLYDYEADDLSNDEYLSYVYVPYDEGKQALTTPREEEAPRDGENGDAFFEMVTNDDGFEASFGVYLPHGFDKERAEPYPVLVILHGGGGSESSWFNSGALDNILDNMIAEGRLEPTVVITPNGTDTDWDRPLLMDNIVGHILPFAEENYNVSTDISRRAMAGLSMGGATTAYAMFHNTDDFQYFLHMSPPMTLDVEPDYTIAALKDRTIFFGYGMYDFVKLRSLYYLHSIESGEPALVSEARRPEGSVYEYLMALSNEGIAFTNYELPYGHDWVLWRKCAVYILDNLLWN